MLAFTNTAVEEAKREKGEPRSHRGVEVDCVARLKLFAVVIKGQSPPPAPVASVPQIRFPAESVSIVLQLGMLLTVNPPPVILSPPAIVDVAVVDVAKRNGAPILVPDSIPPENVDVAVPFI